MNQLPEYRRLVRTVRHQLNVWLMAHGEGKRKSYFNVKISHIDETRLLVLRTWALRYRVTVEEILDLLVPTMRKQRTLKKTAFLGFQIATLTGQWGETLLQEKLKKRYPNGQNFELWRSREKQRHMDREEAEDSPSPSRPANAKKDPAGYIEQYRARVEAAQVEEEKGTQWRRRKKYRNNPYL